MKKIINLILVFFICLQGCASDTDDYPVIENSQVQNTETVYNGDIAQIVIDCVSEKNTNDFFNYDTINLFIDNGYEIKAENILAISNDKVNYDVCIHRKSDGKILTAGNFTAMLSYWEENLVHSSINMFVYGAVANICESELILADYNGIRVYDENTFEEKNITFDLNSVSEKPILFVDILKYDNIYWAAYYADEENQGIVRFDQNGNFIDKGLLNLKNPEADYFGKVYHNTNYNRPFFMNNHSKLIKRENTNQLFLSTYTAYDFDEKMYYNVEGIIETTHDYEKIYIEMWRPLTKGASEHLRITGIKNGNIKVNKFDSGMVEQLYSTEMLTGGLENNIKVALAHNNRDLAIECSPIHGSFIIDRQTNNIRFVNDIF